MYSLCSIVGWIGMAMVLLAYYLVTTQKVSGKNRAYQLLNLGGAIGIGANVWHQQAWPAVVLQVIWGLIAIISLFTRRRKSN